MNKQLKRSTCASASPTGRTPKLLSTELQQGMEVVTGVTGSGTTRQTPQPGRQPNGNPLMPGGGAAGRFRGGGGGRGR